MAEMRCQHCAQTLSAEADLAKARADAEEMRQKVIGAREWGVTLERDLLAARADLSEARRQIEVAFQDGLAKGYKDGAADLDTLIKGLEPCGWFDGVHAHWHPGHRGYECIAARPCESLYRLNADVLAVLQAHKETTQ